MKGWRMQIEGRVQGVGFRPFIANFSRQRNLPGWVKNTNRGVTLFWGVDKNELETLIAELRGNLPPAAIIDAIRMAPWEEEDTEKFNILPSDSGESVSMNLTPDLGICPSCEKELFDPRSRYFHYPFVSCTDCGPRYSVQLSTPYDREKTTMKEFPLCKECGEEYADPGSRRYHAQSISCPQCRIPYRLLDASGQVVADGENGEFWTAVDQILQDGKVMAVKGIGGYLLICDATNIAAVTTLRERKKRPAKPFALLYRNAESAEQDIIITKREKKLLSSSPRPIVLCAIREHKPWMDAVAPELEHLGIMMPSAPMLNMIAGISRNPLIATSGNISGSPIIYKDDEAVEYLGGIADFLLVNDREIIIPQDDSVLKSVEGYHRDIFIRRSRGYAPAVPVNIFSDWEGNILAMGGDLKSTVSWRHRNHTFTSQFMGNMSSYESQIYLEKLIVHWQELLKDTPDRILVDAHPAYFSHQIGLRLANAWDIPLEKVFHHEAHAFALMAEHTRSGERMDDEAYFLIWDGTGYGRDGTIWGGELFSYKDGELAREAHLKYQAQWSGDKMSLEPRISAFSYTRSLPHIQTELMRHFSHREWEWYKKLNNSEPQQMTSSTGRLFDAAAILAGWKGQEQYEGQAAMWLESRAWKYVSQNGFPEPAGWSWENDTWDPSFVLSKVFEDAQRGNTELAAARFHAALIELVVQIKQRFNTGVMGFSGGVFQNQLLVKGIIDRLGNEIKLLWHSDFSPNDESISLGQLASVYLNEKTIRKSSFQLEENY